MFHYVRQRRAGHRLNPVSYVVVPVAGAIICAYLLSQLDSNAITLGLSWLVLGIRSWPRSPGIQGGTAGNDGDRKGDG